MLYKDYIGILFPCCLLTASGSKRGVFGFRVKGIVFQAVKEKSVITVSS